MLPRLLPLYGGLLLVGALAGCQATQQKSVYENDPLVMSKKPIEGTSATAAAPVLVTLGEPLPPVLPVSVRVADTVANHGGVQATPVARLNAPVPIIPASRTMVRADPPPASEPYGRDPNMRWLQGVLEKHYLGYFDLRYADPSLDDHWGGKVRLEYDPRLAYFHDGDAVRVEGYMVPGTSADATSSWDQPPRYKVRDIRLLPR